MTSTATKVAQVIIERIEKSVRNKPYGQIMLENILDEAQELVNTDGYRWDVALAKACRIYPATRNAPKHVDFADFR